MLDTNDTNTDARYEFEYANSHEYKYKLIETKEKIESKPRETKKKLSSTKQLHQAPLHVLFSSRRSDRYRMGSSINWVPCVGINTPCMDVLLVCVCWHHAVELLCQSESRSWGRTDVWLLRPGCSILGGG